MVSSIEDKVFIVTGGAVGVGAGVVRNLLTENARFVAFLDIKEREGTALEAELLGKFGALRAKFLKCDIADDAQLSASFRQVIDKFYRLDAVINNAAVVDSEGSARNVIDVNLTATINSSLKALDTMSAEKAGNGGAIVNMSSLIVLSKASHLPVYAATKAGVLQFSNAIGAPETYSKTKVRVMTICLGPTDTAILHRQSNLENVEDYSVNVTSSISKKQKVESAVLGIMEVIKHGESGSTWTIVDDQPAKNITKTITDGYISMYNSVLGR